VRIVQSIHELYPGQLQWRAKHFDRLVGSDNLRKAISQNQDLTALIKTWQEQVKAFQKLREKYELY
jgi:uncharacterized protein YbbC (DUF1343 family)